MTGFDRPAQGTWNPATQGDASSLLLGLQAHHGSGLSSGGTLLGALVAVVTDVSTSLVQHGISALIVVNGHGGNYVLGNVVQKANADGAMRVGLYPSREDWAEARQAAGITSSNHDDMHAGELRRPSCSPLTRATCVTAGSAMTTSPLIAAISPPLGSVHIRRVV